MKRARELRGVGEVGGMCRIGDGGLPADGQHRPSEFAPEHVTPEGQADLVLEEMRETVRREMHERRRALERHAQVLGFTDLREHRGDATVETPARRTVSAE